MNDHLWRLKNWKNSAARKAKEAQSIVNREKGRERHFVQYRVSFRYLCVGFCNNNAIFVSLFNMRQEFGFPLKTLIGIHKFWEKFAKTSKNYNFLAQLVIV